MLDTDYTGIWLYRLGLHSLIAPTNLLQVHDLPWKNDERNLTMQMLLAGVVGRAGNSKNISGLRKEMQ